MMPHPLKILLPTLVVIAWAFAPAQAQGPLAPILGSLRSDGVAEAGAPALVAAEPPGGAAGGGVWGAAASAREAGAGGAPAPAAAGDAGPGSPGQGDGPRSPAADGGESGRDFFGRDPLGFDAGTPGRVAEDVAATAGRIGDAVTSLSGAEGARRVAPWIVALLLGLVAFIADRRVRRLALGYVDARIARPGAARRLVLLELLALRMVGQVAVPAAALALSWFPVRGLFDGALWTVALSDALAVLVGYRAVVAVARAVLLGPLAAESPEGGARLLRGGVAGGRLAMLLLMGLVVVEAFAYRPDAAALLGVAFRAALLLTFGWVWLRRRDLLALLPVEGSARYQAFRRVVERWQGPLLAASVALLLLYALGFRRAAVTILVRSYGIVGLLVVVALVDRWMDRLQRMGTERQRALVSAIVRRTDVLVTMVVRLAIGAAILAILGLWAPLVHLLQTPWFSVGSSAISVWSLVKAAAVMVAAILLSRAIRVVLEEIVFPRKGLDVGVGYAIVTAVHYVVILNGVGVALIALGIDLSALAVFAGALGVGIGLGLQDVTRNLVSGFILLFGGMVKKGDLITVKDTYTGRVSTITSRSVTVLTNDQSDLIIPSTDLVNSTIINWTRTTPHVRLHVAVGVSYRAEPPAVREALLEAARRCSLVLETPAPDVWLVGFGDNSVNFELLVWIDATRTQKDAVSGKLMFSVWEVLAERSIEIPFPQRDLHVRSVDPEVLDRLRG